jgi:hypothetical protein
MIYHKRNLDFKQSIQLRTRIEDKVVSDHTMKACRGNRGIALLIHSIDTTAVPLGKDLVTQSLEEWVGPKTSLDNLEKRKAFLSLLELEPRILHPYTLITRLNRLLAEYLYEH